MILKGNLDDTSEELLDERLKTESAYKEKFLFRYNWLNLFLYKIDAAKWISYLYKFE